jgi:hypothetical protein
MVTSPRPSGGRYERTWSLADTTDSGDEPDRGRGPMMAGAPSPPAAAAAAGDGSSDALALPPALPVTQAAASGGATSAEP